MFIRKKYLPDLIIFFLLGSFYVYTLCLTIMESTVLEIDNRLIYTVGLTMLALFFAAFYNRYTLAVASGFMLLCLLFVINILRKKEVSGFSYDIKMYWKDLFLFIRGYLPYEQRYSLPIIIFICAVIALYAFFTLYIHFNFYLLAALGLSVFIISWIVGDSRSDITYLLFLFCLCVFLCKHMNRNSRPNLHNKKRSPQRDVIFTLSVMPVCLIVVLIAYLLPSTDKEGGQRAAHQFLNGPLNTVNEFFYVAFNPKYFSFQTTGFTGRHGRLGGKVSLNDRGVMDVYTDTRPYLAGAVRDVYTGSTWESTEENEFQPYNEAISTYDFNETSAFLDWLSNWQSPNHNFREPLKDMTVNIGTARTGTIFQPIKNNGLQSEYDFPVLMNTQGDIRTEVLLPSYTEYNYQYLNVDYTDEEILTMLRALEKGYYQKLLQYYDNEETSLASLFENLQMITSSVDDQGDNHYNEVTIENFSYSKEDLENLALNASMIYQHYTSIPDTVPQRVYDLVIEITADYDNDYDRIKAIESYLSTFPYTLTPADIPDNADFVDYFLFEGKEGYCTYYASAMAIMSRCIGLPSRYVEGYIMPPKRNENGAFSVTNRQAHSWAEVYFEGFGWVAFEATAPFSFTFYQREVPTGTQVFSTGFMNNPYYQEYLEEIGIGSHDYTAAETFADTTPPQAEKTFAENLFDFLRIVAIILICILLYFLFISVRMLQEKLYFRRIKTYSRNRQAREYFLGILKMARYYHYPISEHETPAKYAARIGKRFAFDNDKLFMRDLVKIFYKAEYGGNEISDSELDTIESAYFELLRFIRYMRREQIFLFSRYVLRVI